MKSKSRYEEGQNLTNWWTHYKDGQTPSTHDEINTIRTWPDQAESIDYTCNPRTYNPCKHWKFDFKCKQVEGDYYTLDARDKDYYYVTDKVRARPDIEELKAKLSGELPDGKAFAARAVQTMTPTMEAGFEIANFIYELKDFKTLFKWWDRGKRVVRNLGSGTLNYNFGVVPFLSDVERLYKGLATYEQRLRRLQNGVGKLQKRHYTEKYELETTDWTKVVDSLQTTWRQKCKPLANAEYTATMAYTYSLPDLSKEETHVRAMLDTIGAQVDLYTVWNMIPYSFVVDWFFDIGGFLRQYRNKWITPKLKIANFGYSVKAGWSYDCYHHWYPSQNSTSVSQFAGEVKYYSRRLCVPDDQWFIDPNITGELTVRKFILGALLLEQRL